MYDIKIINKIIFDDQPELNWNDVYTLKIDKYNWNCDYQPVSKAKLCFIENEGFYLKMWCEETNPLSKYTKSNDPVYKDSCLEFFVNFFPNLSNSGYINFEVNSNGAMLCQYGTRGGKDRKFLLDIGITPPSAIPFKNDKEWGFELFIDLKFIKKVYGINNFKAGDILKGNFFKCGDDTEKPHFGSYTKIKNEFPSFHQPDFFADLIMV